MSGAHLWMTVDEPRRFFLVPEDVELLRGDLAVRDLNLATRSVDPAVLEGSEIDIEAAQSHVNAGWVSVISKVRSTWREILRQDVEDTPPDLAAWLGVTPGEVALDRQKRRQGRRSLLEKAGSLFGGLDVDRAEQTLDRLGASISRDAARVRDDVERFARDLTRPSAEPEGEE